MTNKRTYNPALEQRLLFFIEARRWKGLYAYLDTLSNADFWTAGHILANRILKNADADLFFETFHYVVDYKPKAFLVTLTKELCIRLENNTFSLNHPQLFLFAESVRNEQRTIDCHKFVSLVLPSLKNIEDIQLLFRMFGIETGMEQLAYLKHCPTMPAAYLLFKTLKQLENDTEELKQCCLFLKRRGDRFSFNLASIIICYFGLTEIGGTFSLRLLPYELNYLDSSFDTFSKVMTRV